MTWGKKEKMKTEHVSIVEAAEILGVSYSAAVQAARRYGWRKINAGQGPNGGRPRIMYVRSEVETYGDNRSRQTFKSKKVDETLLRAVESAARNKKPIGRIARELGVSHFLIGSAAYELVSKGKR